MFVFSWKAGKLAQLVSGRYLDFDSFFFSFLDVLLGGMMNE